VSLLRSASEGLRTEFGNNQSTRSRTGVGGGERDIANILDVIEKIRDWTIRIRFIFSKIANFPLFKNAEHSLHPARYAEQLELAGLIGKHGETISGLLLAIGPFGRPLRILATPQRRELGNIGVIGRSRCGKGLYATAQLLTWEHSAIVNDIKGDMFHDTAGPRLKMGNKIFVIDTRGVGNTYDPFRNRNTEDELLAVATNILLEAHEGEGSVFTRRAIKMLTQLFKAAKLEGQPPIAYAGPLLHQGIIDCAQHLQLVSTKHNLPPEKNLATRFLDVSIADVNYEDRFLQSCWSTLDKMEPIITETVIKSLSGSDFSARDLILGDKPVTVYLRWPELHVQALAPLIRLVCCSLFDDLITIYDDQKAKGRQNKCRKILALLSEAARAPIPGLPEYAATLAGRHISVWAEYQSRSQPETIYGPSRADTLWGNLEAQIYYRPAVGDIKTAEFLQIRLGGKSGLPTHKLPMALTHRKGRANSGYRCLMPGVPTGSRTIR
jgi:hypothetical protein